MRTSLQFRRSGGQALVGDRGRGVGRELDACCTRTLGERDHVAVFELRARAVFRQHAAHEQGLRDEQVMTEEPAARVIEIGVARASEEGV